MKSNTRTLTTLGTVLLCLGAVACQPAAESPSPAAPEPQQARLPVTHNELMVALVNHAADPIWVAAWRNPQNEKEWRELERLSYQLQIAGSLLTIPGTGPLDEEWAANSTWKMWASELGTAGAQALEAAQSRDSSLVAKAGDVIVEACEGCHLEFKPDLPTGGVFGELSPTEGDFEDGN